MTESETRGEADAAVSLAERARRQLTIANLVAAEVPEAVDEVAEHLRAGWAAYRRLRAAQLGDAGSGEIEPDFLPEDEHEAFRRSLARLMDPGVEGPATDIAELRRQARWLTVALGPAEEIARKRAGLPNPARRTLVAATAVVVLFVAIVGGGFAWRRIVDGPAPWRVTLYAKEKFEGKTVTRMHDEIDFRWGKDRPVFRIPNDRFSLRADSCLNLNEETTLGFLLLSDDGSRLFIDGDLAIDNWGLHGEETKVETFVVEPGMHHLRVEFFDRTENARLLFTIDDEEGVPLSRDRLRPPAGDVDAANPCNR